MSSLLNLTGKTWVVQGDDLDLIKWFESYFRTWVINNGYVVRDTIQSDITRLYSKNLTLRMNNVAWIIRLSKSIGLRELNLIKQNLGPTLIIYTKNWNLIEPDVEGIVTLRFHKSYRDISWKNLSKLLRVQAKDLLNAFNQGINLYDWLLTDGFIPTILNSKRDEFNWLRGWIESGINRMLQLLTG